MDEDGMEERLYWSFWGDENDITEDKIDRFMTEEDGGEVVAIVRSMNGQWYKCTCGAINKIKLQGYLHNAGYEDSKGKRWWLYTKCPRCGYDWALWKIGERIIKEEKNE